MSNIIAHLRSNVVGYVALFFALCTGAYAATLAPDSVRSRHIKDGQVRSADIASGAVTGEQVNESTLGEVRNATIAGHGGYGRQSGGPENGASCNPEDALWITCASVALTPSAPGRVLLTGRLKMTTDSGDDAGEGECRLGSSASGGIPGTTVFHFVSDPTASTEWIPLTGLTGVIQPGNYSFGIDCRETGSGIEIEQAQLTAVVISPF